MNLHQSAPTDPDAFLRWNEGREGKRELVKGRIVEMMIHVTRGHARLVSRFLAMLSQALDSSRFDVFVSDFGVKTPDGVRYPDLVVDVVGGNRGDLAVIAPVLVCEVLSPSSLATDFVEKAAEYTSLPSVQAYLVLSQDEPRVWLWSRQDDAWTGPAMIEGADALIELPSLSLQVTASRAVSGCDDLIGCNWCAEASSSAAQARPPLSECLIEFLPKTEKAPHPEGSVQEVCCTGVIGSV